MNNLNEKITDSLEGNDFRIFGIHEQGGDTYAEIEFYSPAGEDVICTIWYDGTSEDFIRQFEVYARDFDANEHAVDWIIDLGHNANVRALIYDAEEIKRALENMAEILSAIEISGYDEDYIRENWQEILESEMPYDEISKEIEWGFTREDLQSLMRLHKEGICRSKIEDLLTDCNFHTECGNWSEGNYVIREEIFA